MPHRHTLILSLFDHSGNWSAPYVAAGYRVVRVDLQEGLDVLTYHPPTPPHGVLAAPPCTIWTNANAHRWRTIPAAVSEYHRRLILATLALCRTATAWWCLENPRGRLGQLLGPHVWEFQPWWYGDSYTKRTCLWGRFNLPAARPVLPIGPLVAGHGRPPDYPLFPGSATRQLPGPIAARWSAPTAAERLARANHRSATPPNFAAAYFAANP